jgi:hypothetical protein
VPPKSNLGPSARKIPVSTADFILSKEFAANTLAEFTGGACHIRPRILVATGPDRAA